MQTYMWLLETFLECMSQVKLVTIIIDGDKAIRTVVRDLLPECYQFIWAFTFFAF